MMKLIAAFLVLAAGLAVGQTGGGTWDGPGSGQRPETLPIRSAFSDTAAGHKLITVLDLDGAFVKSITPGGLATVQLANNTETTVQLAGIGGGGTTLRFGTGAPANSLGDDGDSYVDTSAGTFYLRASGTYTLQYTDQQGAGGTGITLAQAVAAVLEGNGITIDRTTADQITIAVTNPFEAADETKLDGIAAGAEVNVQADWNEATATADSFILNKPTIPTDTTLTNEQVQDVVGAMATGGTQTNITVTYQDDGAGDGTLDFVVTAGGGTGLTAVASDATLTGDGTSGSPLAVANPFEAADETKLDGVAAGAEVNVQADWNETDTADDSYIDNKPTIPGNTEIDARIGSRVQLAAQDDIYNPPPYQLDFMVEFPMVTGDVVILALPADIGSTNNAISLSVVVGSGPNDFNPLLNFDLTTVTEDELVPNSVLQAVQIANGSYVLLEPTDLTQAQAESSTDTHFGLVSGNRLSQSVAAFTASLVARVAALEGGNPPPQDHTNRAAISADTTLDETEYNAGTTSATGDITIPTWNMGTQYVFLGVPSDEDDITGISQGGIDIFHGFMRVTGTLHGHKWWRTIAAQSTVGSGITYRITQ